MLRHQLQERLLPALRAVNPLHHRHLFSTSSGRFVVEDYLVDTCGLTPAQARKASKYLPHLKSPEKPDAVRAFLTVAGVSEADAATAITRDRAAPLLQCRQNPNPAISRFMTIFPRISPLMVSRLAFYLSFLGSYDNVHTAIRSSGYLLSTHVDNVVKPNIELLLQCGLTPRDVATLCSRVGVLFTEEPERVKEMVARADKLGVPRNAGMFKRALQTVHNLNPRTISAKMDFLKKALGCSESELAIAVCQIPTLLTTSVGKLGRTVEFLKVDVGLEPGFIVRRQRLFIYGLEKRLIPRHYVIKVLKAKGLVKKDIDFKGQFTERMLERHKESVPGLASAYAAACAGKVPSEIIL
ncbi:hypothetical protein SETIT_1G321800v2 [Setaria italica]|uniref:Uncharacterized protein n=1 Tax=Setaria italica TaxID=4555 RepID=A0A368PSA5_SETIT|nr:hypothetical protein SETIT_1G321800v2 [Setaria italica]